MLIGSHIGGPVLKANANGRARGGAYARTGPNHQRRFSHSLLSPPPLIFMHNGGVVGLRRRNTASIQAVIDVSSGS